MTFPSLKILSSITIIKHAIDISDHPYYENIVLDVCNHIKNIFNNNLFYNVYYCNILKSSIYNNINCYYSYTTLKKKKIDCKYKGQLNDYNNFIDNFLCDEDDITVKYINDILNTYVDDIQIVNTDRIFKDKDDNSYKVTIPAKIIFTFTNKMFRFIMKNTTVYSFRAEFYFNIDNKEQLVENSTIKFIPHITQAIYINGVNVPIIHEFCMNTYITCIVNDKVKHDILNFKNNIDINVSQINNEIIKPSYVKRFIYDKNFDLIFCDCSFISRKIQEFKSSPHSNHMSTLHYMLLTEQSKLSIWDIVNLIPSTLIKAELLGEVQINVA